MSASSAPLTQTQTSKVGATVEGEGTDQHN